MAITRDQLIMKLQKMHDKGILPPKFEPIFDKLVEKGLVQRRFVKPEPTIPGMIRSASRGIPIVGPWLDEAGAGVAAAVHPYLPESLQRYPADASFDEVYTDVRNKGNERDEKFKENFPDLSQGLELFGTTATTLPLMGVPAIAKGLGLGAETIWPMIGRGAASTAAIGAAGGAGEGDTGEERGLNAAKGGVAGGIAGALIPPLAKAGTAVIQAGKRPVEALGGMFGLGKGVAPRPTKDVRQVYKAFERDAVDPAKLEAMGEEAMLLNAGPNLRAQGKAIAQEGGTGSQTIRQGFENQGKLLDDRVSMPLTMKPTVKQFEADKKKVLTTPERILDAEAKKDIGKGRKPQGPLSLAMDLQFGKAKDRMFNMAFQGLKGNRSEHLANDMANVLTRTGSDRGEVVRQLMGMRDSSKLAGEERKRLERMLKALLFSGAQSPASPF